MPSSSTKSKVSQKRKKPVSVASDSPASDVDSSDIDASDFEDDHAPPEEEESELEEEEEEEVIVVKKKRKASTSASKKSKKSKADSGEDDAQGEDEDEDEEIAPKLKLAKGQKVVRKVVKAPKSGHVPPGRVSQNTFDFLSQLLKPEYNDRDWFWANEPAYRLAQAEWNAFVHVFTNRLMKLDDEIPYLPPKDIVHRIARDIRFSNDRTPYKTNLSVSLSRTGRKGIFAHYHVMIKPNDRSMLACGIWGPAKDELALFRQAILRSSNPLRKVLSSKAFVGEFGEPKPYPAEKRAPSKKKGKGKGKTTSDDEDESEEQPKPAAYRPRRSVFGGDDALKIAPKLAGVTKDHKDIEFLKLRSVAVIKYFTDEQVLSDDWMDELLRVVEIAVPFVHLLNEMVSLPTASTSAAANSSDDDDDDA